MGLYNVTGPCVVGKLHYVRPTTQPIEVDDAEAAELVESGALVPYAPEPPTQWSPFAQDGGVGRSAEVGVEIAERVIERVIDSPARKPGTRRKG